MCSDVLGGAVDINCSGVDLAFAHHENQLAQSEAFWGTRQWVNFFLHTGARVLHVQAGKLAAAHGRATLTVRVRVLPPAGHRHIEGLEMSKSLKNFITIRAALTKYRARQLRCVAAVQQRATMHAALAAMRLTHTLPPSAQPAVSAAPLGGAD